MTTNPEAGMRLAKCPFCGSRASLHTNINNTRCKVECVNAANWTSNNKQTCGATTLTFPSVAEAITAWNTRAAAPVAPAGSDGEACNVPPAGWKCSREKGHEGPCAARPDCVFDTVETMAQRLSKSDDPDARHAAIMLRELAGDALAARAQPPGGEVVIGEEGEVYTAAHLKLLLDGRDAFIVNQGLWPAFCDQCYTHPTEPAARDGGEALFLKLIDTLKPLAEVAEKLAHCHVVEICEPHPDNPSRNIVPMPREWFERAADDMEAIAILLHRAGTLSEGQASKITGLDRVEVRKLADAAGGEK